MYEITNGSKRALAEGMRTPQIAGLIRQDVKAAQAAGDLPDWMKVSITSESFSMGSAIRVEVRYDARLWEACDGFAQGSKHEYAPGLHSGRGCQTCHVAGEGHARLTAEAEAWATLLKALHFAYNFDGSESQVDYFHVGYYGQVTFESEFMAGCRESEAARKKARAAARKARRQAVAA